MTTRAKTGQRGDASTNGRSDDRVPPHNLEAEAALLGSALLSPAAVAALVTTTTTGDFYSAINQHIADAIRAVAAEQGPVNGVTVADELRRRGLLDEIGGPARLAELQLVTPATSGAARYAKIVADTSARRQLIAAGAAIAESAYHETGDLAAAVADAVAMLGGVPIDDTDNDLASWSPVDLGPVLDGTICQPMPTVLRRLDEEYLLYPGAVNGVHGDSGAGKGWVVCQAFDQELRAGNTVMLLDFEDTAASIVARLILIGVPAEAIRDRLIYIRPQTEFGPNAVEHVIALCVERGVSLVVVDSLGEAFALEGIDENKDVEVGPWYRRVARPIADAGPAVLLVDHSTKAADNPLHPSGSKRKRAAITGASYFAEAVKPFVKGGGGRLRLTAAKDRHGNYRKGEIVANLVMAPTATDRVRIDLHEPDTTEHTTELAAILAARSAVLAAKNEGRPLSKTALRNLMKIKASTDVKRAGVDLAIGRGALREDAGPRSVKLISYVNDFPEQATP